MVTIGAITARDEQTLEAARGLWRAYRDFLHNNSHAGCDGGRLDREIESLPEPYAGNGGEVLVAAVGTDTVRGPEIAGTIAYQAMPPASRPSACEVKRLFVSPGFRGCGVGEALVREALHRAHRRGYARACLDTAPAEMAAAHRLYRRLGFVPMASPPPGSSGIVYLERSLP